MIKVILVILLSFAAYANVERVNLDQAIEFGLEHNKALAVSAVDENIASTDINRIKGEFRPQIDIIAGVGPIRDEIGNSLSSQTRDQWGASWQLKLESQLPLYAWGRKSDLLKAASLGVKVKQEEQRDKQNQLIFDIKEAYYGYLFTESMKDFVKSSLKDLRQILKKIKKKKDDYYRLSILINQVEAKNATLIKSNKLARKALALRVGKEILPQQEWLAFNHFELKEFSYYLDLMQKNRPELQMLRDGVVAKEMVAKANRKAKLPVLAMIANYNYASTPGYQNQQSRFANDPYNRSELAIGIGFKWDIDFGINNANYLKSKAEHTQLVRKQEYAQQGLALELQEAWLAVEEATAIFNKYRGAYKQGKKWFRKVMMGATVGLVDGKRIADAYQGRAMTILSYYQAIFDYYKAWAKLSKVVGIETETLLTGP